MSIFETIYCSQYYELKATGRDPMKGRSNGTVLLAAIILLILISVFVLYGKLVPHNALVHFFKGTHMSGKAIGKIVGLLGLGIIYGLIYITLGSKSSYQKMVTRWEQLPEDEIKKSKKNALVIFFIAFGFFLAVMVASFI